MIQPSPFSNRLKKNLRRRMKWARREGVTAFRLYDHDIPEYAYTVDWYAGEVVVSELASRRSDEARATARRQEVTEGVRTVLDLPDDRIHLKVRAPKVWGKEQYEKKAATGHRRVVEEGGLRFFVNLEDYLDTGLFLDHRNTRSMVREEAAGKRFLNLFAYTGSFTVYAAAGGAARTTTVDLSNTYLDVCRENLRLNDRWDPDRHELIRADVVRWLRQARGRKWDLIVLDPPSFSVSKEMRGSFEIQRDHPALLRDALSLLDEGGTLYFSTHFTGFELDLAALRGWSAEELTPRSIPEDFANRAIHRCWRIRSALTDPRGR